MTILEKLQINNEKKVFYRRVMMLTIPIIVQNLIASLLNLMDTVMIGRLGELYLASVGIANQYFFFEKHRKYFCAYGGKHSSSSSKCSAELYFDIWEARFSSYGSKGSGYSNCYCKNNRNYDNLNLCV